MSYRGVFLDKVHPNVRQKLDNLQMAEASVNRYDRTNMQRTPWIKLTSNAASEERGFPNAGAYILQSSVIDTTDPPEHGKLESWGEGAGYGKLYGGGRLNKPRPAIESITISNKGTLGSIRSAQIKGTIYAESDLEWFEKLYMMPGITLVLEWGWSDVDESTIIINSDSTMESLQQDILKKTLQSTGFDNLYGSEGIDGGSVSSVGEYDAMVGVITKFNWSNSDNGYTFTLNIISPNSVMNSHNISSNEMSAKIVTTSIKTDTDYVFGKSEVSKPVTTSTSTPLADFEAMLTHLSLMSTDISDQTVNEKFKFNEGGKLEQMSPSEIDEADKTGEQSDSGVDAVSSTNRKSELIFGGSYVQPYSFIRSTSGRNICIADVNGQVVGARVFVPKDQDFNPDKAWTDVDEKTFISWEFFESMLSMTFPRGTSGSKIAELKSTTMNADGLFSSNEIFGHPDIFSVNRDVCMLVSDKAMPHPTQAGMFSDNLPEWTNKENFDKIENINFLNGYNVVATKSAPYLKENGRGQLSGVWLNIDMLLQKYHANKSELNKYIHSILDDVNKACGNPWDFHIQNNANDPRKISVIDLNMTPNAAEIRDNSRLSVYTFRTNLGIIKNVNLSSKLPKGVQTAAYIAASSANAGEYVGTSAFSLYNDPATPIYDSLNMTSPPKPKNTDEPIEAANPKNDLILSAWKSLVYGIDQQSAQNKAAEYVDKIIFQNNVDNPGFMPPIPIQCDFELEGLAGIYMGNAIMLDTIDEGGMLPNRYKGKVVFQVTTVSHNINNSGWTTSIAGMMRSTEMSKVTYTTPPTNTRQNSPNATPGANGPASSKSPTALHPTVQAAWNNVVSELQAAGWQPRIITAFRSLEDQYSKFVNNTSTITFGNHCAIDASGKRASQALDVVDLRYSYGNSPASIAQIGEAKTRDKAFAFWGDFGRIAKSHGFDWGGDWSHKQHQYNKAGVPTKLERGSSDGIGWDHAHIEMFGGELPSMSKNMKIAADFYGRGITRNGNNVI